MTGVCDSAAGASPKFTNVADQECCQTKVYLRDGVYCTRRMVQKKQTCASRKMGSYWYRLNKYMVAFLLSFPLHRHVTVSIFYPLLPL